MKITIYKPTGEIFQSRKDAKKRFGEKGYRKLLNEDKLIFTDTNTLSYELQENTKKHSREAIPE